MVQASTNEYKLWSLGALERWSFGALELWSFGTWNLELVTRIFLITYEDRRIRDGQPHAQHLLDERLPVHTAFVTASFVTASSATNSN